LRRALSLELTPACCWCASLPLTSLREQVTFVVSAIGRGLVAAE
jgi:hypothetical protein